MATKKLKVLILENLYFKAKQFQDRFAVYDIKDVTHVTTARDCIAQISKKCDVIFLDYDLSNAESFGASPDDTGATVAQWIKDNPNKLGKKTAIVIHSGSEYGAAEMKKILPDAHIIQHAWKKDKFDEVVKVLNLGSS